MTILCHLGFHDWKYLPQQAKVSLQGRRWINQRECKSCHAKQVKVDVSDGYDYRDGKWEDD